MGGRIATRPMGIQDLKKDNHEENPFSLTFGTEATIPAEIGLLFSRVISVEEDNDVELRLNLDLLEERRLLTTMKVEKYKR